MMNHLKRSLWLCAWSVWAWLGYGLYCELPRDLGAPVSTLPVERLEFARAFVDDQPIIVTQTVDDARKTSLFRRWDAISGMPLKEWTLPTARAPYIHSNERSFARLDAAPKGFRPFTVLHAGIHERSPLLWSDEPTYLFDLAAERVIALTGDGAAPIFHQREPWAIFSSGGALDDGENFVVVLDLRAGRRLFAWCEGRPGSQGLAADGDPFFVGDDRIAIPPSKARSRTAVRPASATVLEVWSIASGARATVVEGAAIGAGRLMIEGAGVSTCRSGRIAWADSATRGGIKVFDLESKSVVFVEPDPPPRDEASTSSRPAWNEFQTRSPVLSDDGGSVLKHGRGPLFDVDSGRVLWSALEGQAVVNVDGGRNFEVGELWKPTIGPWSWEFITYAVRRLADGALEYRTTTPTLQLMSAQDEGPRLSYSQGEVRELPPRVDWLPVALCQFVLALPLLLLWIALRWRRKRRAIDRPAQGLVSG
jgi:hypothetical protein